MRLTKNSFGQSHNVQLPAHEIPAILYHDEQIGYLDDDCDHDENRDVNRDGCPDGCPDDYPDENGCDVWNGDHGLLNGGNANDYDFDGNCYGDDYVCFYYYDVCRHSAYLGKNGRSVCDVKNRPDFWKQAI